MAERKAVYLVDDLEGGEAEETIEFGIDGVAYEIDLNAGNADALRNVLAEYIEVARKKKPATASGRRPSSSAAQKEFLREVREWAANQPHLNVAPRGRIAQNVIDSFKNWKAGQATNGSNTGVPVPEFSEANA